MEQGSRGGEPFDWQSVHDNLLIPSDGHKQEDGSLDPEHEVEEIKNKITLLTTRAQVQDLKGDKGVDDQVRTGLRILKDGYPHRQVEMRGLLEENGGLKKFTDVFEGEEKGS